MTRTAVVVIALVVVVLGISYGLEGLHHHKVVADSCQVVGESTGTVYEMTPDQLRNASIIADLAMRRSLPQQAVIVALATAMQESKLINLDYGDRDSIGLFQQRPSQGWGTPAELIDPIYASGKFFDALLKVSSWQTLPVAAAAQAVQRSGYPDAYTSWQPRATALAAALTGTTFGRLTCRLGGPGVGGSSSVSTSTASAAPGSGPAAPSASASPAAPTVASVTTSLTTALSTDLDITSPQVVSHGTSSATITVSGLDVESSGGDDTAEHRVSTVAAWALAHAAQGITEVVVGDQAWRPTKDGWQLSSHDIGYPGDVVMTVTQR